MKHKHTMKKVIACSLRKRRDFKNFKGGNKLWYAQIQAHRAGGPELRNDRHKDELNQQFFNPLSVRHRDQHGTRFYVDIGKVTLLYPSSHRLFFFPIPQGLEHLGDTLFLLLHVWVNIKVEGCGDIGVTEQYAYCLVVAIALNAACGKAVA